MRCPGTGTCTLQAPRWPSSNSSGTRASSLPGSCPSVRVRNSTLGGSGGGCCAFSCVCLRYRTDLSVRYPDCSSSFPPIRLVSVFGLNLFELTFMLRHGLLEFVLMGVVFMGLGKHMTGSYRKPWGT